MSTGLAGIVFSGKIRKRLSRALLSAWNCLYGIFFMLLLPLAMIVLLAAVLGLVTLFLRLSG